MQLFKKLNDSEIQEFIDWANENYEPFSPINGCWHPVVQHECFMINKRLGQSVIVTDGEDEQ